MRRSNRLAVRNYFIQNQQEFEYATRLILENNDIRNIKVSVFNGTDIYLSRNDIVKLLDYRNNQETISEPQETLSEPQETLSEPQETLSEPQEILNQDDTNDQIQNTHINTTNISSFIHPNLLNILNRNNISNRQTVISEYEEDSNTFDSTINDFSQNDNDNDVNNCMNTNVITLENYTVEEDPIMIYTLNSINKFEKAVCMLQNEWDKFLLSDKNIEYPSNIMCIAKSPIDYNISGIGSKPTKDVIIKLPHNQLYITLGSAVRIKQEYNLNKIWYAFPLYNNKKRRIINIRGSFGSSMNHGQIPGFKIYKLLRRDEIKQNTLIKELPTDYPRYTDNKYIEKDDLNKILDSCITNSGS